MSKFKFQMKSKIPITKKSLVIKFFDIDLTFELWYLTFSY